MNDANQPTILVKKADGTSVRMTMDELQAYKKAQVTGQNTQSKQSMQIKLEEKQKPPAPGSVPVTPVVPVAPVKKIPETQNLTPNTYNLKPTSTPAPIKETKLELPKTLHQQSVEMINEKKPEPKPAQQPSSPYNLVPKTSFIRPTPPPEEKMFTEKWEKSDNASLLEDDPLKENLPVIEKEGKYMPTNTTPVKNIFVDEAKYNEKQNKSRREVGIPTEASGQIKQDVVNNIIKFDSPSVKPSDLITKKPAGLEYIPPPAQIPQTKQIIQDIKPPQIVKQSVGPVDELENFSLDDFRRLEINSKAAGLKLVDKFETLKQDSYLLFIDGVKAWYNSPLYRQYQDVLYQSLVRNKSVSEILTGGNIKKDLKLEEFRAILEVNEAVN